MFKSLVDSASKVSREFAEVDRLFLPENKSLRRLVFYAESEIYFRYYEDYIRHILQHSNLEICYITSDFNDQVFQLDEPRLKPFYIKNLLSGTFAKIDAKVLVLTAPDLNTGVIKRAPGAVHHVYAFHGVSSTHQYFRKGAFDHYDALLCVGQYQIDEIRKTEEVYGLAPKELILTGYPRIENIWREHQEYEKNKTAKERPVCLIAPSWWWEAKESSLLETVIEELIDELAQSEFDVWLRPHPEYMKRYGKRLKQIEAMVEKTKNIKMQTKLSSTQVLHVADVLITDHSTICCDFALGTERPVLFIDTPIHVGNPEASRLGMEIAENSFRNLLGARLSPAKIHQTTEVLRDLLSSQHEFKERLPGIRDSLLANWQKAGLIGGQYLIDKTLVG